MPQAVSGQSAQGRTAIAARPYYFPGNHLTSNQLNPHSHTCCHALLPWQSGLCAAIPRQAGACAAIPGQYGPCAAIPGQSGPCAAIPRQAGACAAIPRQPQLCHISLSVHTWSSSRCSVPSAGASPKILSYSLINHRHPAAVLIFHVYENNRVNTCNCGSLRYESNVTNIMAPAC